MIGLAYLVAEDMLDLLNEKLGEKAVVRFYSGTRPAFAHDAIPSATFLGQVAFSELPFPHAILLTGAVVLYLNNLPAPGTVINTGVADFFRAYGGDGTDQGPNSGQVIMDGSVSNMDGSGDCKLLDTSLIAGQQINLMSWQISLPL